MWVVCRKGDMREVQDGMADLSALGAPPSPHNAGNQAKIGHPGG